MGVRKLDSDQRSTLFTLNMEMFSPQVHFFCSGHDYFYKFACGFVLTPERPKMPPTHLSQFRKGLLYFNSSFGQVLLPPPPDCQLYEDLCKILGQNSVIFNCAERVADRPAPRPVTATVRLELFQYFSD